MLILLRKMADKHFNKRIDQRTGDNRIIGSDEIGPYISSSHRKSGNGLGPKNILFCTNRKLKDR